MIMVKIIGKILVVPLVIGITAVLGVINLLGKVGGFFVGVFNLILIAGAICALWVTGSWDLPKQAFVFLVVENIIVAIATFGIELVQIVRDKLMEFMVA